MSSSSVILVSPQTFSGIHNVDIDRLSALPESALRPILPCLVRMSLCAPLDSSARWTLERKKILKCLSGVEVVNSLVGLLSIDFHELEQDAKKELQLRLVYSNSAHVNKTPTSCFRLKKANKRNFSDIGLVISKQKSC